MALAPRVICALQQLEAPRDCGALPPLAELNRAALETGEKHLAQMLARA